jgi:hypothetical protein
VHTIHVRRSLALTLASTPRPKHLSEEHDRSLSTTTATSDCDVVEQPSVATVESLSSYAECSIHPIIQGGGCDVNSSIAEDVFDQIVATQTKMRYHSQRTALVGSDERASVMSNMVASVSRSTAVGGGTCSPSRYVWHARDHISFAACLQRLNRAHSAKVFVCRGCTVVVAVARRLHRSPALILPTKRVVIACLRR